MIILLQPPRIGNVFLQNILFSLRFTAKSSSVVLPHGGALMNGRLFCFLHTDAVFGKGFEQQIHIGRDRDRLAARLDRIGNIL